MKANHSPIVKEIYPVMGLSCVSCASSAQKIVLQQEGVITAEVNFASSELTLAYRPELTTIEKIKKQLQSAGYDLVLKAPSEQAESVALLQKLKFKQLKIKTYWALLLTLPVVVVGMFFMDMPNANIILFVFSSPVVLWLGSDFYKAAYRQAKIGSANMDTLVALSTGIAYGFSVFNMLFASYWHEKGLHAHVYFEAAAVIISFILLGRLLEEKAKASTSAALQQLMQLQPKMVTLLAANGSEKRVLVDEVQLGDVIIVKPGEQIAVDGKVIAGSSYIDESLLSGEAVAVLKTVGDKVYAGTLNQKGSFRFEAAQVGSDTLLAQIIHLVRDAQNSKAPVQHLVDKIAAVFVPVVVSLSLITFSIWLLLGNENAFEQALLAAVTVLVIACPCALGLATPTAFMVGVGKAAQKGILIKDAESLQVAQSIHTVLLDKTGTLTVGQPAVVDLCWTDLEASELVSVLVAMEQLSEHPLADAVLKQFDNVTPASLSSFESITGKGITALYRDESYYVGNPRLLREQQITLPLPLIQQAEIWAAASHTVIWFANSSTALAVLAIADQLKPSSAQAVALMQQMGLEVHMLTGDNEATAKAVAQATGIRHYKSGVLPQDKAAYVKHLQANGKKVAMVGDGINDSAALATADLGIAMGKGSAIAMDVAKMTLISSNLMKIPEAILLSKQTVRTVKQNLFWAFIYNIIGIPLAAGVLYPINGFMLNPMIAGGAMALSSLSVLANSLRLKYES